MLNFFSEKNYLKKIEELEQTLREMVHISDFLKIIHLDNDKSLCDIYISNHRHNLNNPQLNIIYTK